MGIVYVIQEPTRRNRTTGELEPTFDLTPASIYGELKVMLPPGPVMLSPQPMLDKMHHELRNYCDDDYILAVGPTAAISAVGGIAGKYNRGHYSLLQWDRKAQAYIILRMKI